MVSIIFPNDNGGGGYIIHPASNEHLRFQSEVKETRLSDLSRLRLAYHAHSKPARVGTQEITSR